MALDTTPPRLETACGWRAALHIQDLVVGGSSTRPPRTVLPCPVQGPRDQKPGIGLQAFIVLFTGEETEAQTSHPRFSHPASRCGTHLP